MTNISLSVQLMSNFIDHLTFENVFLAAVIAAIASFLISKAWRIIKVFLDYPAELSFPQKDLKMVVERCCELFPGDTFSFRGKNFKRGMIVKVTTLSKKTFEGKLIGINSKNVFCVMTKSFITADSLANIRDITEITD